MIAQHLIRQHHVESLDHFHAAGQLAVDTLSRLTDVSLRHLRGSVGTHGQRAQALSAREQPTPMDVEAAVSVLSESMHVLTESYGRWIALAEAQRQLMHRTTHATLEDLQRWSPAGTEFAVDTAEVLTEALESAVEIAADASVAMANAVDAKPAPAPRRSRRAAPPDTE
ncbi:MAG: hypothetical protein FHP92_07025 [Denitromonas halophila]|nr:MAG: hypothetical protein FHP92_07025 [Denitromonas halophila]